MNLLLGQKNCFGILLQTQTNLKISVFIQGVDVFLNVFIVNRMTNLDGIKKRMPGSNRSWIEAILWMVHEPPNGHSTRQKSNQHLGLLCGGQNSDVTSIMVPEKITFN